MKKWGIACLVGSTLAFSSSRVMAQSPVGSCDTTPRAPFCSAVRGDRARNWAPQTRSEVMAQHGMVATSQPLAAQTGLRILMEGGNAVDAAVATAATMNLMEPFNTGVGGDLFAIVYVAQERRLYVLNASGKAPTGATRERLNSLGYHWDSTNWGFGSGMPKGGILSVTVPGAAWGWDELLRRFGKKSFREVLAPAIEYAENGFPVSERIARDWDIPNALPLQGCCTQPDPDTVAAWTINGQPPVEGQIFRNPDLARTFRLLQRDGRDVFYKGEIANAIVAKSTALGGTMTLNDLRTFTGEWVEPAATNYHGYDVFELPAPSQAWGAIETLNILEVCVPQWVPGQTLASLGPANPMYWHMVVEAKKLAYNDLYAFNSDPSFTSLPMQRLLSKEYAATLCSKFDPNHAFTPGPTGNDTAHGDTIVLSTADRWGNMVSMVTSNFSGFGSGITVPGYGFVLHNRGSQFTLDPKSPNVIEPHKRPYNTLSAGFVMKDGVPLMTIGLMGGDIQAQGHVQTLVAVLDLGANLQAATDMARFRHNQVPNTLTMETELYKLVGAQLAAKGHHVSASNGSAVGGYQAIMFTPYPAGQSCNEGQGSVNGFYRGGSDHRKDGAAVGY